MYIQIFKIRISMQQQNITDLLNKINEYEQSMLQMQNTIEQLKTTIYHSDLQIAQLNNKLKQLQTKNQTLTSQNISQKTILKQYNQNLYNKNIQIQELEQQLHIIKQQSSKQDNNSEQIQNLYAIIRGQEIELQRYVSDERQVLETMEEIYARKKYQYQEREIMEEFNRELLRQVQQVEGVNCRLISERSQVENELRLQNQQANDLFSQVQVMVDAMQSVAVSS